MAAGVLAVVYANPDEAAQILFGVADSQKVYDEYGQGQRCIRFPLRAPYPEGGGLSEAVI